MKTFSNELPAQVATILIILLSIFFVFAVEEHGPKAKASAEQVQAEKPPAKPQTPPAKPQTPPAKEQCRWIYDKARDYALSADKFQPRWIDEIDRAVERSRMWSDLYLACTSSVQ